MAGVCHLELCGLKWLLPALGCASSSFGWLWSLLVFQRFWGSSHTGLFLFFLLALGGVGVGGMCPLSLCFFIVSVCLMGHQKLAWRVLMTHSEGAQRSAGGGCVRLVRLLPWVAPTTTATARTATTTTTTTRKTKTKTKCVCTLSVHVQTIVMYMHVCV